MHGLEVPGRRPPEGASLLQVGPSGPVLPQQLRTAGWQWALSDSSLFGDTANCPSDVMDASGMGSRVAESKPRHP